ncbi:type VI secretion system contractile sheath large subunit [Enterobacter hormaechei subsp. xiangfangensis]|nr:type VI secretion system contractile sheath large subunit [Enterobacter hormaechei subsp. xiangfangensis]
MSVNTETASAQGQTTVLEKEGVYASLFEKINLTPASSLGDINAFLDDAALSDAPAGERLTAAMQVFMDCIRKSGQPVEKLDKTLIDHHIAELDFQISRQLDAVMHHQEFQKVESLWRGLKQLVDSTDYLKLIQRENIGTTKDRRLLELELNTWVRSLVTEMTDPGDELQASHPLRDAKVVVEDIEDNPGFFRVKLFAVPHFQVEGMDVNLSLVSQMPKAKA